MCSKWISYEFSSRRIVDYRLYQSSRLDWGSGKISTNSSLQETSLGLVMSPAASLAGISRSNNWFTRRGSCLLKSLIGSLPHLKHRSRSLGQSSQHPSSSPSPSKLEGCFIFIRKSKFQWLVSWPEVTGAKATRL